MLFKNASILAIGLLLLVASSALARKWTSSTGKQSVEAEFVRIKGNKVVLKKPSGALTTVPIARLSKADQKYLKSLSKPDAKPADDRSKTKPKPEPTTKPVVVTQDKKLTALLNQGSVVSIRANRQPIGSVLAQIEKATGNRIRIVDDFDRDDQQVLSKLISLDLQKKSFWDAVDAVTAATDVKFGGFADGSLKLRTKGIEFGKLKAVGTPKVVGAFYVYPGLDDFFGNAVIAVRSEPQLGKPQVRSYRAEITLPDGKQIEYKPDFMFNTSNVHTNEVTLRIKPDLPNGITKAQKIKIEAQLAFASAWKTFTLPTLGELVPKPATVGDGVIYVTEAKVPDKSSGRQMFTVKLSAEGLAFNLKDTVLVDMAGNRVKSSLGGGPKQEGRQSVNLYFPLAKISGEPGKCRLAFDVPGQGEKIIGPIADLAPKPTPAGAATIRVTSAGMKKQFGMEDFEVRIEFDGLFEIRDGASLVGPGGQSLKPTAWGGGGSMAQYWFDRKQIRGKPELYRLTIQAPTMVTEHTLHATFDDVPLAKEP